MPEHKPKYFQYIIGAVLIVVGIILIMSIFENDDAAVLPDSQEVLDETTRIVEATNYEYIMPEEWEFYENAIEDIQALTEDNFLDQVIKFGIVHDPLEPNYVYFATDSFFPEGNEVRISLYRYNEDDYSFERIWRKTYNALEDSDILDTEPFEPVMHVIGYENNKLIVLFQQSDDSPGPCSNPWLMGWEDRSGRNMMTIDLENPYAGFEEYTPSDEALEMAQEQVDECEASFR